MSYNVSSFQWKGNLTVPKEYHDTVWEMIDEEYISESFEFDFNVRDGSVLTLYFGGEGSGRSIDEFKKLLTYTKGKAVFLFVWEGGDSIEFASVNNGVWNQTNDVSAELLDSHFARVFETKEEVNG